MISSVLVAYTVFAVLSCWTLKANLEYTANHFRSTSITYFVSSLSLTFNDIFHID